eukprot:6192174-Pleurochrysis_carterae.AAC.2
MYHSKQESNACKESTLKVRARCVSHGGLDSWRRSLLAYHLLGVVCLWPLEARTSWCAGRAARARSERGGGVKNAMGGRAAWARELRCAMPALVQKRELREGSVRRCAAERRRLHWPSDAGADPAASIVWRAAGGTLVCEPLPCASRVTRVVLGMEPCVHGRRGGGRRAAAVHSNPTC